MFRNVDLQTGFYFLHSFYFEGTSSQSLMAETEYGVMFASAVTNGKNVFGVQFHPEKSHANGVELLRNFARLNSC